MTTRDASVHRDRCRVAISARRCTGRAIQRTRAGVRRDRTKAQSQKQCRSCERRRRFAACSRPDRNRARPPHACPCCAQAESLPIRVAGLWRRSAKRASETAQSDGSGALSRRYRHRANNRDAVATSGRSFARRPAYPSGDPMQRRGRGDNVDGRLNEAMPSTMRYPPSTAPQKNRRLR